MKRFVLFPLAFITFFQIKAIDNICIDYLGLFNSSYEILLDYVFIEHFILNSANCQYAHQEIDDSTFINNIEETLACSKLEPIQTNCIVYPKALLYFYEDDLLLKIYEVGLMYYRDVIEDCIYETPWNFWILFHNHVEMDYWKDIEFEENRYKMFDAYVKNMNVRNACGELLYKQSNKLSIDMQ